MRYVDATHSVWILLLMLLCLGGGCKGKPAQAPRPEQLLFGDLHVHTMYSFDAFPLQVGYRIANDPAAACEYARSCSKLDFFAITDHAESEWVSTVPAIGDKWSKTVEAVQACNRLSDGPLTFAGFEWTSSVQARGVDRRWGHRNVVLYSQKPPRPVAAMLLSDVQVFAPESLSDLVGALQAIDPQRAEEVMQDTSIGMLTVPACDDLFSEDPDCLRVAHTPAQLFSYLDRFVPSVQGWAGALVIPHGTTWGIGGVDADWNDVLAAGQFDPRYERLIEIYSGHGNSESWIAPANVASEITSCAEQAATLTTDLCSALNRDPDLCRTQADTARANGTLTSEYEAYATPESWGTCGECRDCFQPAERYQVTGAVQAGLAQSPGRWQGSPWLWGIIASTDGHRGQPGSVNERRDHLDLPPNIFSDPAMQNPMLNGRAFSEGRRLGSYMYSGGLVAAWVTDTTRSALWNALQSRHVYATSGPRIRLRFSAVAGSQRVRMGEALTTASVPVFEVVARGAPAQVTPVAECYQPATTYSGIDRIEVVRIRPGSREDDLATAIDDPWRVFPTTARAPAGGPATEVTVSFVDPGWDQAHPALYYVRVIQTPTWAVNGKPMHAPDGTLRVCSGQGDDSCYTLNEERAWSSPILVLGQQKEVAQ